MEIQNAEKKILNLKLEDENLQKYGLWTLDYFRIEKTLQKLSANKISTYTRTKLTETIWQISLKYNMDPLLILALVSQESRGNPNVRGRYKSGKESGAYGLMQIKLETAQTLCKKFGIRIETEEDLFKPENNIVLGTAYFVRLVGRYENIKHALIAYNLGHAHLDRLLASGKKIPTKYYDGVISKYFALTSSLNFLNLTP